MSNVLKKIKDKIMDFEESLATSISKIIDPQTPELKQRNSYVSAEFPGPKSQLVELENVFSQLIGKPDGEEWTDPISPFPFSLRKMVEAYEGTTPSIMAKESIANREMIGELGKRAPPLNDNMGMFQDETYRERKTQEE